MKVKEFKSLKNRIHQKDFKPGWLTVQKLKDLTTYAEAGWKGKEKIEKRVKEGHYCKSCPGRYQR
jgi:hypothetical protein